MIKMNYVLLGCIASCFIVAPNDCMLKPEEKLAIKQKVEKDLGNKYQYNNQDRDLEYARRVRIAQMRVEHMSTRDPQSYKERYGSFEEYFGVDQWGL
jgi:hypothetical protein